MLTKVRLGVALLASLAGGGGALAAHNSVFLASSRPTQVSATVAARQTLAADGSASTGATTRTVPTVARGTITIVVTTPAAASSSGSGSSRASATATGDPARSQLALDIVRNLGTKCPSLLSFVSDATKELRAVPIASSTAVQVTATGRTDGTADARATLLVDTNARTVTSTDAVTTAALSSCATLAELEASERGSGALTLTVGG